MAWDEFTDEQPLAPKDWGLKYGFRFVLRFALRRRSSNGMLTYTGSLQRDNEEYPGLHEEADFLMYLLYCERWKVERIAKAMGK